YDELSRRPSQVQRRGSFLDAASSSSSSAKALKPKQPLRPIATLQALCEKTALNNNVDYHALPGTLKYPFYKEEIDQALLNRIGWQSRSLRGHEVWVYSAHFNHDSTRIVSALTNRTLRIWDANSGQCLHTLKGHEEAVN